MKKDIHPKVFDDAVVTCACGNSFVTMSTLPQIKVEICSNCHPFYTGTAKFIDTEGRIEKFARKVKQAHDMPIKKVKGKKGEKIAQERKSLKDLFPTRFHPVPPALGPSQQRHTLS